MYLLDTDTCSFIMKRASGALVERVRRFEPRELKASVITRYELEYGARRSDRVPELVRVIEAFFDNVEVLDFDLPAARQAAAVRAELTACGAVIGSYDLLIAGHARSLDAVLVTGNTREFGRVDGLSVENWVDSAT